MTAVAEQMPDDDRRASALDRIWRRLELQSRLENPLTEHERRVLTGASCGLSTADLSDLCGITVDTVRDHYESCRRKLRARTMAQAVARAIRCGFIE